MNKLDQYVAMLQNIIMQLQLPNMVNPLTQQEVALKQQLVAQYNELQAYISQARNAILQQQQLQRQIPSVTYGAQSYGNPYGVSTAQPAVSVGTTIPEYNGYGVDNGIQASVSSNSRFSKYANKQPAVSQYQQPSAPVTAEVKFSNFQLPKKEEPKQEEDKSVNNGNIYKEFAPGHRLPFLFPDGYTEIIMENGKFKTRHIAAEDTVAVNTVNLNIYHHKGKNINSVSDLIAEIGHRYFTLDGVVSHSDVKYYIPISILKETLDLTTSELKSSDIDKLSLLRSDPKFVNNPILSYISKVFTKDFNKRLEYGTNLFLIVDDFISDLSELLTKFLTPSTVDEDIILRKVLEGVLKEIKGITWSIVAGEENSEKKIICAAMKKKVLWMWGAEVCNALIDREASSYSISSASYPEFYKVISSLNTDRFELRVVKESSDFEVWDGYVGVNGTYVIEKR